MSHITPEDFNIITLALDMLEKHTNAELAKARWLGSTTKQMALITVRNQIANARANLCSLQR